MKNIIVKPPKNEKGGSVTLIMYLIVKVRMQTMPTPAPGQAPLYTSSLDLARKMFVKEVCNIRYTCRVLK